MKPSALALVAVFIAVPMARGHAQTATQTGTPQLRLLQEMPTLLKSGPSTRSRIATGVGGAILGAGLGFFASQVVEGDWQDGSISRQLWAVAGGAVGFSVGFRFPISFGGGGAGGPRAPGFPTGRDHLSREEFRDRGMDNAHEAVQVLRPDWLQVRGNQSLSPGLDPVVIDGTSRVVRVSGSTPLKDEASAIQVYVDGVHVGALEALSTIALFLVRDMYFFDAARATFRFGGNNPHGAILIVT